MIAARKAESYEHIDYSSNVFDYNYAQYQKEQLEKKVIELEKVNQRKVRQKQALFAVKTIVAILAAFGLLSFIVIRYASINEMKYENFGLKQEINNLNLHIEDLNQQLESYIVLDNVEQYAKEELGMQYPQPEQIVYINSMWSYTLDADQKLSEEEPVVVEEDNNVEIVDTIVNLGATIETAVTNKTE